MWRVAHRGRPVQVEWPHGRSCRASLPPPRECAGCQKPLHRHTVSVAAMATRPGTSWRADGGSQDGIDLRQRSSCCVRCLLRPRWGGAAQGKCARCGECCRLLQNIAAGRGALERHLPREVISPMNHSVEGNPRLSWSASQGDGPCARLVWPLCIRQQLRPAAGPILRAASAHSRRRAPSSSAEQETCLASQARSGKACRAGGCGDPRGQPGAQERRAACHGLWGPPVWDFRTSTR